MCLCACMCKCVVLFFLALFWITVSVSKLSTLRYTDFFALYFSSLYYFLNSWYRFNKVYISCNFDCMFEFGFSFSVSFSFCIRLIVWPHLKIMLYLDYHIIYPGLFGWTEKEAAFFLLTMTLSNTNNKYWNLFRFSCLGPCLSVCTVCCIEWVRGIF